LNGERQLDGRLQRAHTRPAPQDRRRTHGGAVQPRHARDFLDWDKPLSQQSEKVRGALAQYGIDRPDWTGGQIYKSSKLVPEDFADKKQAAQRLKEAGIAGVRYLDQGSRASGEGSRNLAIFDDKLIEILRKYGLLGMAGGAAAAEYGSQNSMIPPRPASPQYRPGDA